MTSNKAKVWTKGTPDMEDALKKRIDGCVFLGFSRGTTLSPTSMAPRSQVCKRKIIFQVPSRRCHVGGRKGKRKPGWQKRRRLASSGHGTSKMGQGATCLVSTFCSRIKGTPEKVAGWGGVQKLDSEPRKGVIFLADSL